MDITMLAADFEVEAYSEPLDLFSTSASIALVLRSNLLCEYGAPYFAFCRGGGRYAIVQGCCNHWECIRCGEMVAKKHYGRIVEGARKIHKDHPLQFITITCRGMELSAKDALENYGKWTHRFLRTCQQKHVRAGGKWFYAQVTEAQKRGHPHSHILASFSPHDLVNGVKQDWVIGSDGKPHIEFKDALRSDWIQEMVQKAGLGEQYDISRVESVEACSRYVAKYMFKDSQFGTHFPKGWKRVRYSQNWPKLKSKKTGAFVLLSSADWHNLATLAVVIDTENGAVFQEAQWQLRGSDAIIIERKNDKHA